MKRQVMGLTGVLIAMLAIAAAVVPDGVAAAAPTVQVKWNAQSLVSMSLTPNYFTGFGQVKATFGTQPTPTFGPDAGPGVGQGDVDFGDVLAGVTYIYKYAAHLNVSTNDPSGFKLYGEGAAAFYNTTDGTSLPLATTLFYAVSTSGSPADTNTGYTPGQPFQQTTGIVSPAQPNPLSTPSINYGGSYPSVPVATSASSVKDFYYDYILKVPATATNGLYFVWIVYTVVPQ